MNFERILKPTLRLLDRINGSRAALLGVSGIDGSGKGHLAEKLNEVLSATGARVAMLTVDDWLALPEIRFSSHDPARHFYHHGLRLEEMFETLVLPLKAGRGIELVVPTLAETATTYRPTSRVHRDIDVVLLEGIFIFKQPYQHLFDLGVWVDCSFETALERAIARGQEGLDPSATAEAYHRIYFPAQRFHLAADDPISATHFTIRNDRRIPPGLKRVLSNEVKAA